MVFNIISGCAALITLIASFYSALVPGIRGWAGLDDALIRVSVIGVLALISLITASFGLYMGEPYKVYLLILVVLTAIPAIAFIIFSSMILIKSL